jgi:hypothetical protein
MEIIFELIGQFFVEFLFEFVIQSTFDFIHKLMTRPPQ